MGFYLKDLVKKQVVSILIAFPVLAGLIYIIKWGGQYFFVYAWFFTLLVILVSAVVNTMAK